MIQADLVNFPLEVTALATGFGGGIGSSGNNCGALTGAVIAVGMKIGRISPDYSIDYRAFNRIPYKFEALFGSPNCKDLVKNYDFSSIERKEKV